MNPKQKYKAKTHALRSKMREKGQTFGKEKSYFEHSHKERHNIRENAKPGSNARKYLGKGPNIKEPFYE